MAQTAAVSIMDGRAMLRMVLHGESIMAPTQYWAVLWLSARALTVLDFYGSIVF